jgi:ATP-dependent Lon protease
MQIHIHSTIPAAPIAPDSQLRRRKLSGDQARRLVEIRRLYANSKDLGSTLIDDDRDEAVTAALDEFDEAESSTPQRVTATHQLYRMSELEDELKWAKSLTGESRKIVVKQLEMARDLGSARYIAAAPDPSSLKELRRDFPNFGGVLDFIERRLLLCRMGPAKLFKLPPILLSGPPGVGKTWFAKKLAQALTDIPYAQADLSQSTPGFAITGLDAAYDTGRPGLIWKTMQNPCASPIILFDEIDKAQSGGRDGGVGFLLGLLEKSSARQFQDAAVRLRIDVSTVLWFATCNELLKLDEPVLSRFRVFEIAAPTNRQMRLVVESVNREMLAAEDWSVAFDPVLPEQIMAVLREGTPREIKARLEDAYASAAVAGRSFLAIEDLNPQNRVSTGKGSSMGFINTNTCA